MLISKQSSANIKHKKQKFTKKQMIFWGFNIIVGYTFLIALSGTFKAFGSFVPIMILVASLIAFGAGRAFGKLSQKYDANGGTLLYTRKAFGYRVGGVIGFFQLLQLPINSSTVAIAFVWAFNGIHAGGVNLGDQWYIYILAFILYLLFSIVPYFGFTNSKISLFIFWFLKWSIIVGSIIASLFLIKSYGHNIGQYIAPGKNMFTGKNSINFFGMIAAFTTFFFAFGGFEVVASMSNDLKDAKKNIASTIAWIVILVALFYIFYYFIILGCVGPKGISSNSRNDLNPFISVFSKVFNKSKGIGDNIIKVTAGVVAALLALFLIITQIFNKGTSRTQSAWGNTRIINAYSSAGYLSPKLQRKNKYGQFYKAFWLDFIIASVFTVFYLIVQLIIVLTKKQNLGFIGSGALQTVAYISFIQYLGSIAACLWLAHKKKKIKISLFDTIYFSITAVLILFFMIMFLVGGFVQISEYIHGDENGSLTSILTTSFIIIFFIIAVIIVWNGERKGWNKNNLLDVKDQIINKIVN